MPTMWKKFLLIGSIAVIVVVILGRSTSPYFTTITVGEQNLTVEIAKTARQQESGLSGRDSLKDDYGMLFVFDQPTIPSFWMKDMRFPIDIIWIGADGSIAGIEHDVQPDTYPKKFSPASPIMRVLEVNAGWANRYLSPDKKTELPVAFKILDVPFIGEAPSGNWTGPWKNACEEASIAMVEFFYQNKKSAPLAEAEEFMSMLFAKQDALYGNNVNSDAKQFKYLIENFASFKAEIKTNPTIEDIKDQIDDGHPVISMHYGFDLHNPNIPFLRTGTSYHAMVIIGYDDLAKQFIVNDDGDTKAGAGHRYEYDLFMNTLHEYDYTTKKAYGVPTVIFTSD